MASTAVPMAAPSSAAEMVAHCAAPACASETES